MSELFGFPSMFDKRLVNMIANLATILVDKKIMTEDEAMKIFENLDEGKEEDKK